MAARLRHQCSPGLKPAVRRTGRRCPERLTQWQGRPQGFEDWLKLFQVVGPTLTLPGGSAIVLTIWLMARRAQQAERRAQQAERKADAAENMAASAKERLAAAQAQAAQYQATIADLQAELERRRGQS